jgi:hypothetical protein
MSQPGSKRCILWGIFLCVFVQMNAQTALSEFTKRQHEERARQYDSAQVYAKRLNLQSRSEWSNGQCLQLMGWVNGCPIFYTTHNAVSADYSHIPYNYESSSIHESINGRNMIVGLWDAGHVLGSHQEFSQSSASRIIIEGEVPHFVNHSTHIGGTLAAGGKEASAKGMAYQATVLSKDFVNDFAEMSYEAERRNNFISNHSYGPVSGWTYNIDEEKWYWYGDVGISEVEDYKFGFYGTIPAALDELAYLAPHYLMVISAGNDRDDAPEYQPISHKVFLDKWRGSNDIREPDGGEDGYECIGMNAVAKNVLTVGAIDAVTIPGAMTPFSSWGPTDDGRIKPDVVAPGVAVYSSMAGSTDAYGYYSGTSMATACVTGGMTLLQHLQLQLQPNVPLMAATQKAILIHSAVEAGSHPGPDYQYGWGVVNFEAAHVLLEENVKSGGALIINDVATANQSYSKSITCDGQAPLKITLVWTDLPGQANQPALNPVNSSLINDLDIKLVCNGTGEAFFPWVLDPSRPDQAASTGVNSRDNVEQIYLENPIAGDYQVLVDGAKINSDKQAFSLIVSGHDYSTGYYPPLNLTGFYHLQGIELTWDEPQTGNPNQYEIWRNNDYLARVVNPRFIDVDLPFQDTMYYKVRACYGENDLFYSCFSNEFSIKAMPVMELPIQEDFEQSPNWWTFSNNQYGWRWGSSETLNSYYLIFDGNTTGFMGVNSDALGRGAHVNDYLISPPFWVSGGDSIHLNFSYYMDNTNYHTNDHFALYYRSNLINQWQLIDTLRSVKAWTVDTLGIRVGPEESVAQVAFLYDDLEEWGMGAGIDNIKICSESLPTSMNQKEKRNINVWSDSQHRIHLSIDTSLNETLFVSIYNLVGMKHLNHCISKGQYGEVILPFVPPAPGIYFIKIYNEDFSLSKPVLISK